MGNFWDIIEYSSDTHYYFTKKSVENKYFGSLLPVTMTQKLAAHL